ncbi:MAG: polyphosphate kinase 2 family protein [Myxococcota bacterium]
MKPILFPPVETPFLVPFDGSFRVADAPTSTDVIKKKTAKERLGVFHDEMEELQERLYADDRFSVLLVFQAMDAAGKDGTIRAVMTGINPAGCQVFSFKQPSTKELEHDFLWRVHRSVPERGRIGIFNRSHYEEVLVIRVHPEYLRGQSLPRDIPLDQRWEERFDSIRQFEKHLARNGTVILKFWLNVSRDEQRQRFLDRIDEPEKNWKFSAGDVKERGRWDDYMDAYEAALNETSRPWAPWYAIPADDKRTMRVIVAETLLETMKRLDLSYPSVSKERRKEMKELRHALAND